MNIRFEYLYRDFGNFKQWGEVIFSNPNNIDAGFASSIVEQVLIERVYFVASKADIPNLYFSEYIEEVDHGWHEFHSFSLTDGTPNDPLGRNIEEFITSLRCASKISVLDMKELDMPLILEGINIISQSVTETRLGAMPNMPNIAARLSILST
ncbi:MAG: hypothetical protein LM514_01790 [Streptococcus sp.]|jgi:hypothetical protein|nr:hypothetical protein [Streptococcus sp.]